MEVQLLHKNSNLHKLQLLCISMVEEIIKVNSDFKKIANDVYWRVRACNEEIKLRKPQGHKAEFDFTTSIFEDEKKIFIASHPTGEDFYMIQLKQC